MRLHVVVSLVLFTAATALAQARILPAEPVTPHARGGPKFKWGADKVRGVNLGGWLVLEPWITPSLFEDKPDWVVDEWSYAKYMNTTSLGADEIRQHWATWFDYEQLKEISSVGLNTVRIPVGYWSLIPLNSNEPYYTGAFAYLKMAVTWASQLRLNVMLDLHGAPAGQNLWDNCGRRGVRNWFGNDNANNIKRTLAAIDVLLAEFSQDQYNGAVSSIALMNEPLPFNQDELGQLRSFYEQGYQLIRQNTSITVVLSEAYQGLETWQGFMPHDKYSNVGLDLHIYNMFDEKTLAYPLNDVLRWMCGWGDRLTESDRNLWTIVGEFTTANTDCAYWLNGRGSGSRYDNTLDRADKLKFPGDCETRSGDPGAWTAEYMDWLQTNFETQTWVYEQASGWIYWTWRTESAADWSLQWGLTYGWIPNPVTKRRSRPCNFSSFLVTTDGASGGPGASTHSASGGVGHGPCWKSVVVIAVVVVVVVVVVGGW